MELIELDIYKTGWKQFTLDSAFISVVPKMDMKAAGLYLPTKLHDILFHSTTILILTTLETSNNNETFTA